MRGLLAFALVLSGPTVAADPVWSDLPPEARECIERDWELQEGALGRDLGDRASLEALLARGRSLITRRAGDAGVAAARAALDAVEGEIGALRWQEAATPALVMADGWRLERASVCGAGAELDRHRVRGADYRYPSTPRWASSRRVSALATCSWDPTEVLYRFEGLDGGARRRIRALYGVDAARTLRLSADGVMLHEASAPDGTVVEAVSEVPPELLADGALDVRVGLVTGPNVIISGLELWTDDASTPETEDARLLACRALTADSSPPPPPAAVDLYRRLRRALRDLVFAHPALDFDQVLFVERQWPSGNHQCAHRVGEHQTPGADLRVLTGLHPAGEARRLLPPEMAASGGVGRPDLSWDASRIVFPYAAPRAIPTPYPWAGGHAAYDPLNPRDSSAYRGGACEMYDLWEIGVDGSGLRRLTDDPNAEDTEPCYLPDGRIAFTSSRGGRIVQCGDWALVFGLWAMGPDGSDPVPITEPQDTEFYPSITEDGRILYTRWDYVMKPYNAIQQLWSVRADGTGARLAYGDWFEFTRGPIALQEARQVPGTSLVSAIGAAHHNTGAGPLMLADLALHRAGPRGLRNLTPEIGYPEAGALLDERTSPTGEQAQAMSNTHHPAGWVASPWPLAPDLFLASCSFDEDNASAHGYGIYLVDGDGSRELIHRLDAASCYAPIPLRPRARPSEPASTRTAGAEGLLYVQDARRGLPREEGARVRWLQVCETYPKERHTNPHRVDVGVGSGWDMRGVLGVVPVAADGSAYFRVPADRMLFLQALDAEFLEVRRMRSYVDLRPGEVRGCVGCHDRPAVAAVQAAAPPASFGGAPRALEPPPWGAGPLRFEQVVQPVLDRRCVSCHDGAETEAGRLDLRGGKLVVAPHAGDADEGPQHHVTTSFLALLPYVSYVRVNGHGGPKLPLAPRAVGSGASELFALLREDHHGLALPLEEWRALAAWVDLNAPYYGSYDDDIALAAN